MRDEIVDGLLSEAETRRAIILRTDPHFRCKVQLFGLQLDSIEKNMREMIQQINDMERELQWIEYMQDRLTDEERIWFEHIDVQGLREQQKAKVESLRHVIETKMPNVKGKNFLQLEPAERGENHETTPTL